MKRKYDPQKASAAIEVAAKMPSLLHSILDQPFDVSKSEVVDWLVQQPEIRNALFNFYKDKGTIVFDPDSKTWSGVSASSAADA